MPIEAGCFSFYFYFIRASIICAWHKNRHSSGGWNPVHRMTNLGSKKPNSMALDWIPAFAGMTSSHFQFCIDNGTIDLEMVPTVREGRQSRAPALYHSGCGELFYSVKSWLCSISTSMKARILGARCVLLTNTA
jgi:hypothetical protein